ncbi:MAG TPA: diguanylate cyclase [Solirubrobacteraceae bacterium]|nr:diguanylate cyclase [Solirubrobacteraceae bacterium]
MDGADEGKAPESTGEEALHELLMAPDAILEGLPDAVVASARDGRIVFVNSRAEELFGYPRQELLGRPVSILWPERVRARYLRNAELYFNTEHPIRFTAEARGLRRDGSEFVGEMSWGIVETTGGPLLLAIGRDISARRANEARLRAVAAMGEHALGAADPAELSAKAVEVIMATLPADGAEVVLAGAEVVARAGNPEPVALCLRIGDDDELHVACGRELAEDEMSALRAVASTLATALARLRAEERMRHEAVHDPLTGLANRALLRDRLDHALARSQREGGATGLLFVDLDRFKDVNDRHGHAAGDAVLVELGARLRGAVRPTDTVARYGGDEFVVVCEQVDEGVMRTLAGRLLEALRAPITTARGVHALSASVGVAIGHHDAERLLSEADAAVYRAKAAGGGRAEGPAAPGAGHAESPGAPGGAQADPPPPPGQPPKR